MYLHLTYDPTENPAPIELIEWTMAERFGWTLDYIAGLSRKRMREFYQIEEGKRKARPDE